MLVGVLNRVHRDLFSKPTEAPSQSTSQACTPTGV